MNWINNVVRPKIRGIWAKRQVPDNLWVKCPDTGEMVFHRDLEANQFVIPASGYHMRMTAKARLDGLFDAQWQPVPLPRVAPDPLKFRDERRYTDRLKDARNKTSLEDAVLVGEGELNGVALVAAVQDFSFMGGSLGMAAGEAVIAGMMRAVEKLTPFIMFAASGGARMQEGVLSLMQMPRTTVAVQQLRKHKLPYIVVFTNPTTGGVTASYAMLGDVHIAEPGALIGFAGPRVIEQTIRETLPDGFQKSEYLRDHGMIDMVVHRHELCDCLSSLCRLLTNQEALVKAPEAETPEAASSEAAVEEPAEQEASPQQDASQEHDTSQAQDASQENTAQSAETSVPPSANGAGEEPIEVTTHGEALPSPEASPPSGEEPKAVSAGAPGGQNGAQPAHR